MMKYADLDLGTIEAVFNKLGGIEGAKDFLRTPNGLTVFERNKHGHVVVTIISLSLSLTGAQEIQRLEAAGYKVGSYAKSCLISKAEDGYDKTHILVGGQSYSIALMPTKEIERDAERTTDNMRKLGMQYGYHKLRAGAMPRIREAVSNKQMEEMGLWYVVGLHNPIKDSGGDPRVLAADRDVGGRWLGSHVVRPDDQWFGDGAFAFLAPAS